MAVCPAPCGLKPLITAIITGLVCLVGLATPCTAQDAANPAAQSTHTTSSARYCNQKSILIRYRWQGAQPPGVQMWISLDNGSWLPWQFSDKPDQPFTFAPPRQGRVGIALAPAEQETPDKPDSGCQTLWLVFDWDKPLVRLTSARPSPTSRSVHLSWAAWDENLSARPISLHWRTSSADPWTIAATDLPNSGAFEWTAPAELAGRPLELSLRATDLAGNHAEATAMVQVAPSQPSPATAPAAAREPIPPAVEARHPQPDTRSLSPDALAGQSQPAELTVTSAPVSQPSAASLEADRLSQLAQHQADQNNLDAAQELLHQALEADPMFHTARLQLAILLQRRGQFSQAIREYESVLALKPDNTTAWRNLALAYMTAKEYPKARVTLQKLLAIEAANPQAWLDLGDVEMLSGRPDAARQNWQKALLLAKSDPDLAARANKRLAAYIKGK